VKAEARRLGFQVVGIAAAERFGEVEARLVEWVQAGRQGEMAWMNEARARRSCRPDELLEGARSLVVVGAAYPRGREASPSPLQGRVARYARGRDYHDVLKERLWTLVRVLRERVGEDFRCRVFVDTGPLVEREAAVRAGLGFIGKNTCLLTPGAGSFLLLGAILTDLPLPPDRPLERDCGACRLCLDACPTGALDGAYRLDARRCIAYLTIELRGAIPSGLRPELGERLFGCDICQEVCPWNQGKGPIPWPDLAPSPSVGTDLDLPALLALDDAGFRQRFKGSPLKRSKRSGLLRNAAVVLGSRGDRAAVPALARALASDPDPLVRQHAAWALHQLGGAEAEAALALARDREQDPVVRAELSS
jgi:epoxyqueuosine reductase